VCGSRASTTTGIFLLIFSLQHMCVQLKNKSRADPVY
jgi:hypothetical protein